MTTPKVGKDIDAMCTKCKMVLNHVVVAKVGELVKRVKCLTCGSDHVYKNPNASPVRKAGPAGTTATKRKVTARASDYEELMKGRDLGKARRYKPAETFVRNELLNHATFGFGVVVEVKEGSKVEVAFRDGSKTLVHSAM